MQDCTISFAKVWEIQQSCTKPPILFAALHVKQNSILFQKQPFHSFKQIWPLLSFGPQNNDRHMPTSQIPLEKQQTYANFSVLWAIILMIVLCLTWFGQEKILYRIHWPTTQYVYILGDIFKCIHITYRWILLMIHKKIKWGIQQHVTGIVTLFFFKTGHRPLPEYNRPVVQIPQCTSSALTMHHFVTEMCTCVHISVTK